MGEPAAFETEENLSDYTTCNYRVPRNLLQRVEETFPAVRERMNCTNSENVPVGPYGETFPARHDANQAVNMKAEEVSDAEKEEDPVPITVRKIKAEPECVLSVLKFTYPTVFQGWQTLVGVLILKFLTMEKRLDVTVLDKTTAINLLPHCLYLLGAIVWFQSINNSLPVFVSVCNLPPACIFLLDYSGSPLNLGLVQVTAGVISLGAAVSIILLDVSMPFADSGYSWLLAHVLFLTAQTLYSRITNPCTVK